LFTLPTNTKDEKKEWTERGVMEKYHADDDLEQCKAPHVSCNIQKFPFNAKTKIKTCIGIEVFSLKCG
jgi:hypothetical protein